MTLTIVLSVGVLFVLARFRFPDRPSVALPAPQPLERLAARAAFDDLTGIVARASARVRPLLEVVVAPADGTEPRSMRLEDVLLAAPSAATRRVLAYRFAPAIVLVVTPVPLGEVGVPLPTRLDMRPRAHDGLRGVGVLDTTEAPGWQPLPTTQTPGPAYLLIAEAGHGGPALRPLFGSLAEAYTDPRWDGPLVSLGPAVQASHGTLVFSLEGALVGAVQSIGGVQTIVPADLLLSTAERLRSGVARAPATLGLTLQALDEDLVAATGVRAGALVVEAGTLVDSALEPGDVIVAVGEVKVLTPEAALLAIARLQPDTQSRVHVVRDGSPLELVVTPMAASRASQPPADGKLGLTLRRTPLGAEVIGVTASSIAARAGVRVGDQLVRVGPTDRPTPAQVASAYDQTEPGKALLVAVQRGGRTMMLALRKAGP